MACVIYYRLIGFRIYKRTMSPFSLSATKCIYRLDGLENEWPRLAKCTVIRCLTRRCTGFRGTYAVVWLGPQLVYALCSYHSTILMKDQGNDKAQIGISTPGPALQ